MRILTIMPLYSFGLPFLLGNAFSALQQPSSMAAYIFLQTLIIGFRDVHLAGPINCPSLRITWGWRASPSACLMEKLKIWPWELSVPSHVEEAGLTARSWCTERSRAEGCGQREDSSSSSSGGPLDHYTCHSLFTSTVHSSLLSTGLVGFLSTVNCIRCLSDFISKALL